MSSSAMRLVNSTLRRVSRAQAKRLRWVALVPALLAASHCVGAQLPAPQTMTAPPQAPTRVTNPQHLTVPRPSVVITLDQAIEYAKRNNPALEAQRTLVFQSKEQEVTANLRPNPVLSWDAQYLPLFSPDLWSSNYIDNTAQFDAGFGYLFERGRKRQHRLQAAKDVTAVTEEQVLDAERTTVADVAQQFVAALLAKSNLQFAEQLLQSYQHTVSISQEQQSAGAISKGGPVEDPVADSAVPERCGYGEDRFRRGAEFPARTDRLRLRSPRLRC